MRQVGAKVHLRVVDFVNEVIDITESPKAITATSSSALKYTRNERASNIFVSCSLSSLDFPRLGQAALDIGWNDLVFHSTEVLPSP